MKLVILADGLDTRLSEESDLPVRFRTQTGARPKPMVEIGDRLTSPSSLLRLSVPLIVDEVLAVGDAGVIS